MVHIYKVAGVRGKTRQFSRKTFGFNYLVKESLRIGLCVAPMFGPGKNRVVTGLNPESDF